MTNLLANSLAKQESRVRNRLAKLEAAQAKLLKTKPNTDAGNRRKRKLWNSLTKQISLCENQLLHLNRMKKAKGAKQRNALRKRWKKFREKEYPRLFGKNRVASPAQACDATSNNVDNLHTRVIQAGAQRLSKLEHRLAKSCTNEECRLEAKKITNAMISVWKKNYGKGKFIGGYPYDQDDPVGGYLCWDWARAFNQAGNSTNPKYFSMEEQMVHMNDGGGGVHFFVAITPKNSNDPSQKTHVDDGWYYQGEYVHDGSFPKSKKKKNQWNDAHYHYHDPPIDGNP